MAWYPDSFDLRIQVHVVPLDKHGNPMGAFDDSMRVRYSPFTYTTYEDKSAFVFKNAYTYTATITGIKITGVSASSPFVTGGLLNNLPLNVYLDEDIELNRYYDLVGPTTPNGLSTILATATDNDLDCDGTPDQLTVSWPTIYGAEQYDLEWAFVNDYNTTFNTYVPASSLGYNFRFNSTRITTTQTSYGISLIYEHGYLVYRVRAVGLDTTNPSTYLNGVWSQPDSGLVSSATNYHVTTPHQLDSMDYQYNATFAEEGKKKEVVTYYDGSLRSREAVTKMNSDKNVLVGQTIYDYQGRPAVTILPVPVQFPSCSNSEPVIHYFPNFNESDSANNLRQYSRLDFDLDTTHRCSVTADSMSVFAGASNYYSPQNPNKQGFQAYVPDAHGFPFSQVQYTPDNTGRIRAQGGVGQQFQLGSGHETKYIYGQPAQLEIDRMFGDEVGDASHYKKNVVVDPNGQASISYLDQEGRTIATCLAGDPGTDSTGSFILSPLASAAGAQQTLISDLFATDANGNSINNSVNLEDNAIVFNTQLAVAYSSGYSFKYFVQVDTLKFPCANICYSCAYDLDIRITDDCGNVVASTIGNDPIDKLIGNFSIVGGNVVFSTACNNPSIDSNTQELLVNLTPGNYTVSKTLTVDTAALHFYEQQYLDSANGCAKTLNDFQKYYLGLADTCNCHITCASCIASLGTRDNFVAQGKGTAEMYDFLYEQCQAPCKSKSLCYVEYEQMLADMNPGGQYAQYLTSNGQVYPDAYPLSVFNDTNLLPINIASGTGNWHNPKVTLNGDTYLSYLNSDGTTSTIFLDSTNTGFIPQILNNNPTVVKRDPITLKYYTYPENLKNFSDFIGYWQPSWAQSLVQYHPEYCYYSACSQFGIVQSGDTMSSDQFDQLMQNTMTYSAAVTAGFIDQPLVSTSDTTDRVYDFTTSGAGHLYDPFFTNSVFSSMDGGPIGPSMAAVVKKYQRESPTSVLSMVEVAAQAARCGTNYGNLFPAPCIDFGNDYIAGNIPVDDSIRNKEWTYYKSYYLSEKEKLQKQMQNYYALYLCGGYNGCMGTSASFNSWTAGMWSNSPEPFFVKTQPCGYYTWGFYAHKQRRFVDQSDIPSQSQSQANYQYYLLTGQCPMAEELQQFLAALAAANTLTHSGVLLTSYPQFSKDMYDEITPSPPVNGIVYRWDATPSGSTLSANFTDNSTNTVHCTLTLDLTGSGLSNFSNITSFQDLQYTGTVGGVDQFSLTAVEYVPTDTTHPYQYYTIHGSSCFLIHGCKFQQTCSPNQLMTDLQTLMSALAANGNLTGTNVNLETLPYSALLTSSIINTLGTPNTHLGWHYISPGEFQLYDAFNTNYKIDLKFTSYSPNSFTSASLNTIMMFDSANSDYQNLFTINGADVHGNTLVIINGEASIDSMSHTRGLSMGVCGLPTGNECMGAPYQNVTQLQALLNDALTKKPFKGDINLTKDPQWTPQLSSYFPTILDSIASNDDSTVVGNKYMETLTFKLYVSDSAGRTAHRDSALSCPFYITHTDSDNVLHSNYAHLIGITGLTATGNSINGNLQYFYFIAEYQTVTGTLLTDTCHGYSCIPLLNCNACASNEPQPSPSPTSGPAGGAGSLGAPILVDQVSVAARDSSLLASGAVVKDSSFALYQTYKSSIAAINTANGWTSSDSLFVQTVPFTTFAASGSTITMRSYKNYLAYYDSTLDNQRYLNLNSFAVNYGNRINAKYAYHKYLKAISKYNARVPAVLGADSLYPLNDSTFFALGLADSINLYIAYLKSYPTPGHNPVSDTAFMRTHNAMSNNPADSCLAAYRRYINAYRVFERRQLADSIRCPDYPQVSPLYTYKDFISNGLCTAYDTSFKKINAYITLLLDTTQCPGPLPNVADPPIASPRLSANAQVNEEDCKALYSMWFQDVLAFNSSAYATAHGYSINPQLYPTYDAFVAAGLCNCASGYIQYLLPFISLSPMSSTPPPVDINHYGPCGYVPTPKDTTCDSAYSQYINAVNQYNAFVDAHGDTLPPITQVYPDSDFTANGFCYCVKSYIAFLQSVESGTVTAPPFQMVAGAGGSVSLQAGISGISGVPAGGTVITQQSIISAYLDIGTDCNAQETPPCTGTSTVDTNQTISYIPKGGNPCVNQLINNANANAQNAYNNYVDSMLTDFRTKYMAHCLHPIEKMIELDTDKQYHYTLYYYDQAGNLIRTSPPQGTLLIGQGQPVFSYTDPKEQHIIQDRTFGLHTFFTNNVLTSTYVYNSLNQLTKQTVPDDDNMNIWQFNLPNGLDKRLVTTGVQFVDASRGYLSGYVPGAGGIPDRGYLYTTHDAGHTWQRMNGLVAANINKVEMNSQFNGYAVGEDGILLSTITGGNSWDIVPLYKNNTNSYTASLNDIAYDGSAYSMVVGANGKAFTLDNSGNVADASAGISSTDSLTGVSFDQTNNAFIACGDSAGYGVIYASSTSPYTSGWTKLSAVENRPAYTVQFLGSNPSEGFAGGNNGMLLHTTDRGAHWYTRPTYMRGRTIRKVFFVTSNIGVALIDSVPGGYDQIYKTSNGGYTWSLLSVPGKYYTDIRFSLDPNTSTYKGIACGLKGVITRVLETPGDASPYFGIAALNAPSSYELRSAYALTTGTNTIAIVAAGVNKGFYYCPSYNTNNPTVPWDSMGVNASFTKVSGLLNHHGNMLPALICVSGKIYTPITNNAHPAVFIGVDSVAGKFDDLVPAAPDSIFSFNNTNGKLWSFDSNAGVPSTELIPLTTYTAALGLRTGNMSTFAYAGRTTLTNGYFAGTDSTSTNTRLSNLYTANVNGSTVTWTDVTNNTHPLRLYDVRVSNATSTYIVGDDGTMMYRTGISPTSQTNVLYAQTSKRLFSISAENPIQGLVCGDSGTLFTYTRTNNNMALGTIPMTVTVPLYDIAMIYGASNAYVCGAKGTELYVTNAFSITPAVQQGSAGSNDLRGVAEIPGTWGPGAVAVGTNATVFVFGGPSGSQVFDVFTPRLNGVNFMNSSAGYCAGSFGAIRRTDNNGSSWQLVLPAINATGTPDYTTVWTTSIGNAIVAGPQNFIGKATSGNTVSAMASYTYGSGSNTWHKVRFNSSFLSSGYIVGDGNKVYTVGVVGGVLNSVSNSLAAQPVGFTASNYQSLWVFRDNSVIAVGSNGAAHYFNSAFGWEDFSPSLQIPSRYSSFTWNDVSFRDDITGWMVGDSATNAAGEIVKAIGDETIQTSGASFPWLAQPVQDNYNITHPNQINPNSIAFSSPYDGFVAGSYSSTPPASGSYPYARVLNDQGGQFSGLFYYDRLGRLEVSQNSKQQGYKIMAYSYTLFDNLNRVIETGQKTENSDTANSFHKIFGDTIMGFYNPIVINQNKFLGWVKDNTGPRTDVVHNYYDVQDILATKTLVQQNLRNRTASVTYSDTIQADSTKFNNAKYYSYDVHGNVVTLIQDDSVQGVSGQRYKRIDYSFDLMSGNVNEIDYENDSLDQYHHKYSYDANNRLLTVSTSKDSVLWDNDAKYLYYAHQPLARVEIGDQQVQGMDYAYTLKSWIKGMNSDLLSPGTDIGEDGLQQTGNLNATFAADALGYTIKYFTGDYDPIDRTRWNAVNNRFEANDYHSDLMSARHDNFNGNPTAVTTTLVVPTKYNALSTGYASIIPQGTAYKFDQLARLIEVKAFQNLDASSNTWLNSGVYNGLYHNWFTYDANGNMFTQKRADQLGNVFDSLSYQYNIQNGRTLQNRLYHVNDAVPGTVDGITDDIRDQGAYSNVQSTINRINNYGYDQVGNLVRDNQEQIDTIIWSVYGKVRKVIRTATSVLPDIEYTYDASGNRICKIIKPHGTSKENGGIDIFTKWTHTYYTRDADGNELVVYKLKVDTIGTSIFLSYKEIERNIYGTKRIGSENTNVEMIGGSTLSLDSLSRYLGNKHYQGMNYLDNVLTVFSDRKIPIQSITTPGQIGFYIADVVSSTDYYPYGGPMYGRSFNATTYRYGFNGKEKDDEMYGSEGNSYDYGFRIYNPRLGRFLSVDPLASNFPYYSPYIFAGDKPTWAVDIDGEEENCRTIRTITTVYNGNDLNQNTYKDAWGKVYQTGTTETKGDNPNSDRDYVIEIHVNVGKYGNADIKETPYYQKISSTPDPNNNQKSDNNQPTQSTNKPQTTTTNADATQPAGNSNDTQQPKSAGDQSTEKKPVTKQSVHNTKSTVPQKSNEVVLGGQKLTPGISVPLPVTFQGNMYSQFADPAAAAKTLDDLASQLKKTGASITLTGHVNLQGSRLCDKNPYIEGNVDLYHLGENRAKTLEQGLLDRGVPASQIKSTADPDPNHNNNYNVTVTVDKK
jgi:RHS repeat-associated protein